MVVLKKKKSQDESVFAKTAPDFCLLSRVCVDFSNLLQASVCVDSLHMLLSILIKFDEVNGWFCFNRTI